LIRFLGGNVCGSY